MAKRGRVEAEGFYPQAKYPRIAGPEQDPQKFKFESALSFLEQVKRQFSDQPDIYKEFLRIMKEFKGQEIDTPQVIEQISILFKGYDNLIEGFGHFLPQGHQMKLASSTSSKTNGNTSNNIGSSNIEQSMGKRETPKKEQEEKQQEAAPTAITRPPVDDFTAAKNFVLKVKSRFLDKPEVYREFILTLKKYRQTEVSLKDVFVRFTQLFYDYTDLLLEFPNFLPEPYQKTQDVATVEDYTFFENAKIQLKGEPSLYVEFLKCLSLVNNGILSPNELLILVEDLFSDYPDLYEQFQENVKFLMQEYDIEEEFTESQARSSKLLNPLTKKRGLLNKLEIDYSTCKRLGPSYRSLPPEYIQPPSSGRTPLCNEVLNDVYVSLPTGSEEGANFKSSRKSPFEEVLFKCEDERYELDMAIEVNSSTLERLKEIHETMKSASTEELLDLHVDEFFDPIHLKAIEKIYGEKKQEIISNLFNNPVVTIPLLIHRLTQKEEEWRQLRLECIQSWKIIHEKNHHKSLDHRGSTFKQKDKKRLQFSTFLAEIKKEKYFKTKENSKDDHLSFQIDYPHVLVDIFNLVKTLLTSSTHYPENQELDLFLDEFFRDFFITHSSNDLSSALKILYGCDEFFLFVRLIITAYSRMARVMDCSCDTLRQTLPTLVHSTFSESSKEPGAAKFNSVMELYRYFVDRVVVPFLLNQIDSATFEKQCRHLFGVDAYLLFTIDHIFKSIVEQVELLCSDDDTMRLLALYYFETNRVFEGTDNFVYRTNAHEIIGKERLFRMTFIQEENSQIRRLNISLMDHHKEQPVLALSATKKNYKKYLREFLHPSTNESSRKVPVFLQRNKLATTRTKPWNENLIVDNQLEAKICMTTYQLFYVNNTEDFFYRKGSLGKKHSHKKRELRMRRIK